MLSEFGRSLSTVSSFDNVIVRDCWRIVDHEPNAGAAHCPYTKSGLVAGHSTFVLLSTSAGRQAAIPKVPTWQEDRMAVLRYLLVGNDWSIVWRYRSLVSERMPSAWWAACGKATVL